jgi:nucleoside-diphosphate-sugar epimerase
VGETALPQMPNVHQIRHDLSKDALASGLPKRIDAVIHLAQGKGFREFPEHALETFAVNVSATMSLLDWARVAGARTFVLASSGGVYGSGSSVFVETDQVAPEGSLGFYVSTKRCAELLAANYASSFNVVALRFFFVYGPGQSRSMLIPRLIDNISAGRPINLDGHDGIRINPTYVSDAVASVLAALSLESSETINVAGPETETLRSIANIIGDLVGNEPVFNVNDRATPRDVVGDTTKMARLLAAPIVSLREGLRSSVQ